MARRNAQEIARRQKDARQKKMLLVLLPLFLGLVAWQGPKMYKAFFASPTATPPPAATTGTAPTAPPATPPADAAASEGDAPAGLPDTDVPPAAGTDALISFSRFQGRDPFGRPGGEREQGAAAGEADPSDSGGEEAATSAVFDVNGSTETVATGAEFPADDPVFRLVSVSADVVAVGLVSGSFDGGQETVELAVGEEIELVADPDGARYTVTLVSVG